jgi:hypothetical protein
VFGVGGALATSFLQRLCQDDARRHWRLNRNPTYDSDLISATRAVEPKINLSNEDEGHRQGTDKRHKRGYWNFENTKVWVEMFEEKRMSAQAIAAAVGADESTVGSWLKKHGVLLHQGYRREERKPPKISQDLAKLLGSGTKDVLKFLDERVWGVSASATGLKQLIKFCDFLKVPLTVGRNATASRLRIDKSMVNAWTEGTKQPYLVRVAQAALQTDVRPGWKLLPLWLESGGNVQGSWIQVPVTIQHYEDVSAVVRQLTPLNTNYGRGARFGLSRQQIEAMRDDLFAYLLAFLAGDASKAGGKQKRFTSSNIDLHLTLKQPTNERLGDFVCMCTNSLGIVMDRKLDKQPTGSTRFGRHPSAAYRWTSERSPLIAWMFNVGLGLQWGECTTLNCLKMDWILKTPRSFRIRFIQGLADSDGTVKPSEVIICSVPNADLLTKILQDLGMTTAHTIYEKGRPLRTMVNRKQSATLPIFNEFVKSYRYQKLINYPN